MSEWRVRSLIEVTDKIGSGATPRGGKEAYKSEGISLIRSQNVLDFSFSQNGLAFIDEDQAENLRNVIVEDEDILINITGDSVARVCKAPTDFLPARVNQHVAILRARRDGLLPDFLKYFLLSSSTKRQLLMLASSGATRNALTKSMLENFKISLPPLPEQKAIAHILGKLDDKIELNRQMNQTLEAMAQALFKSWFVDFDPVMDNALASGAEIPEALKAKAEKRQLVSDSKKLLYKNPKLATLFPSAFVFNETLGKWIPEGWETEKLGEKLTIKRGGSPRPIKDFIVEDGFPWLKIADATAEKSPFIFSTRECIKEEGLRKTVYLDSGELILSNSATPGLPKFLNIKSCIHDGWLYFPKKEHFTDEYLYFLFLKLREEFIMKGNGSVFTNLKTDILKNQTVIIPSLDVMNHFTRYSKSCLQRIKGSRLETSSLTQLRDTLLPQLISGKVRVAGSEYARKKEFN